MQNSKELLAGFGFYDLTGVAIPGSALLFGLSLFIPNLHQLFASGDIGMGNLGLFVLVSYVFGQLTQTLGNILEYLWWLPWGGKPTNWILTRRKRKGVLKRIMTVISDEQIASLAKCLPAGLGLQVKPDVLSMDKHAWYPVTRQIHSAVHISGRAQRLEKFNAVYGLNRGMCAAMLVLAIITVSFERRLWPWSIWCTIGAIAFLFRMHRFGITYARELFVQFLQLSSNATTPKNISAPQD